MGYTHYWTHKRRFTVAQWAEITRDIGAIMALAMSEGLALGDWGGDYPFTPDECFSDDPDQPEVGPVLGFNGLGEDCHETFVLHRDRTPVYDYATQSFILPRSAKPAAGARTVGGVGRAFCKTARKPYDSLVIAILTYLDSVYEGHLDVSSDGDASEWQDGLTLAKRALPHLGNVLRLPFDIRWESQFAYDPDWYFIRSETYYCRKRIDGVIVLGRNSDPYRPLAYVPAARAETFKTAAMRRFESVPRSCFGVDECKRMHRAQDRALRDLLTYRDTMQGAPELIPQLF